MTERLATHAANWPSVCSAPTGVGCCIRFSNSTNQYFCCCCVVKKERERERKEKVLGTHSRPRTDHIAPSIKCVEQSGLSTERKNELCLKPCFNIYGIHTTQQQRKKEK
ncbi:hypothetical protein BpHYR1_043266, partial [Brachionus plicatilis]